MAPDKEIIEESQVPQFNEEQKASQSAEEFKSLNDKCVEEHDEIEDYGIPDEWHEFPIDELIDENRVE